MSLVRQFRDITDGSVLSEQKLPFLASDGAFLGMSREASGEDAIGASEVSVGASSVAFPLKVSKSQKRILVSSNLPKNQRNQHSQSSPL